VNKKTKLFTLIFFLLLPKTVNSYWAFITTPFRLARFVFSSTLSGGANIYFLGQIINFAYQKFNSSSPFYRLEQKISLSKMPSSLKSELYEEIKYAQLSHSEERAGGTHAFINQVLHFPWRKKKEPEADLKKIYQRIDSKIFGMHKIKKLVLDLFFAYHEGRIKHISPLCLYGPPGTGKTAFAVALAKALNLPYIIISATGANDPDAFFRGSLRTYVGSAPGFFFSAFSQLQCINPLIIIDEIDKQAVGNHRGTIQNVLLQALDPVQNKRFRDYYLNHDIDISNAFIITTANDINLISDPLQDRMLMVKVDEYSEKEREIIASTIIWNKIKGTYKIPPDVKKQFIQKALLKTAETRNIRSLKKILTKKINRWLRLNS